MSPLAWLDKAVSISTLVSVVASVYDQHRERRRRDAADARDVRVRELEQRIARLESQVAKPEAAK